ncbi:GntR family transcriptional regulator [Psychrobacillus sp. OK032]
MVFGEITGEVLPKVEDLSEIYGVSRTVVRESC